MIVGVTTECCVTSTLKEANDRGEQCFFFVDITPNEWNNCLGFECLLIKDATDGYVGEERKAIVVDMITLSQVRVLGQT